MYTCNIDYWKLLCAESATRLTGSVAIGGELDKHVSQDGLIGTEDPHAHLHVPDLLHDHVGRTVKSHTHRVWRRERARSYVAVRKRAKFRNVAKMATGLK